jgi:hypothetical protein
MYEKLFSKTNQIFLKTPLITIFGFCLFSGILSVLVALGLLFFKEKPPKQENIVTLREVILLVAKYIYYLLTVRYSLESLPAINSSDYSF